MIRRPHWSDNHPRNYSQPAVDSVRVWFFIVGFIFGAGLVLILVGKSKVHPTPQTFSVQYSQQNNL